MKINIKQQKSGKVSLQNHLVLPTIQSSIANCDRDISCIDITNDSDRNNLSVTNSEKLKLLKKFSNLAAMKGFNLNDSDVEHDDEEIIFETVVDDHHSDESLVDISAGRSDNLPKNIVKSNFDDFEEYADVLVKSEGAINIHLGQPNGSSLNVSSSQDSELSADTEGSPMEEETKDKTQENQIVAQIKDPKQEISQILSSDDDSSFHQDSSVDNYNHSLGKYDGEENTDLDSDKKSECDFFDDEAIEADDSESSLSDQENIHALSFQSGSTVGMGKMKRPSSDDEVDDDCEEDDSEEDDSFVVPDDVISYDSDYEENNSVKNWKTRIIRPKEDSTTSEEEFKENQMSNFEKGRAPVRQHFNRCTGNPASNTSSKFANTKLSSKSSGSEFDMTHGKRKIVKTKLISKDFNHKVCDVQNEESHSAVSKNPTCVDSIFKIIDLGEIKCHRPSISSKKTSHIDCNFKIVELGKVKLHGVSTTSKKAQHQDYNSISLDLQNKNTLHASSKFNSSDRKDNIFDVSRRKLKLSLNCMKSGQNQIDFVDQKMSIKQNLPESLQDSESATSSHTSVGDSAKTIATRTEVSNKIGSKRSIDPCTKIKKISEGLLDSNDCPVASIKIKKTTVLADTSSPAFKNQLKRKREGNSPVAKGKRRKNN